MGSDVAPEIEVCGLIGFSPAAYFCQIRDHQGRIAPISRDWSHNGSYGGC